MAKNNLQKKSKEIPADILKVFFSENTISQISKICLENNIKDGEKIKEIAYQIGLVLLGKSLPNNLSETLQEKVRLEKNIAENIYFEANRVIFSQIKKKSERPLKDAVEAEPRNKAKAPVKKDIYLEEIE